MWSKMACTYLLVCVLPFLFYFFFFNFFSFMFGTLSAHIVLGPLSHLGAHQNSLYAFGSLPEITISTNWVCLFT